MQKNKVSKRGLIFGIIACIFFSVLAFGMMALYFSYAINGAGLAMILIIIALACIPGMTGPWILFFLHLYYSIKDTVKGKGRILSLIPTYVLVGVILTCSSICCIHYATADKVTFGIPETELEKLSIDGLYQAAMDSDNPNFVVYDSDHNPEHEGKDTKHQLIRKFKELNAEGPGKYNTNSLSREKYVRYHIDSHYEFNVYESGIAEAVDYGEMMSQTYRLYYSFDSSLADSYFDLALSII